MCPECARKAAERLKGKPRSRTAEGRAKAAEWQRRRAAKRFGLGLCVRCDSARMKDGSLCTACRERQLVYMRRRNAATREIGRLIAADAS